MFENVIGHKKTISSLKSEITQDRLAPSILLSGECFQGKLTIALEIARSLTCKKSGKWNCDCSSCEQNRMLTLSDLLIIGRKDCILEIKAAEKVLLENKNIQSYYLFLRAVKKLTSRFDKRLYEGSEAAFLKASSLLPDIEEGLNELKMEGIKTLDDKKLSSIVSSLEKKCEKLQDECLSDSIPISQVRKAISWIHLKASDKRKILIIENADAMQEASRNALLKTLEEPPSYATFILTTQNKNAIMPTILSRLRVYELSKRGETEEAEVLKRVFSTENEASLSTFFYNYLPIGYDEIKQASIFFLQHIASSKKMDAMPSLKEYVLNLECTLPKDENLSFMVSHLNKFKPSIVYSLFLKETISLLRASMLYSPPQSRELKSYKKILLLIEKARIKVELYNMQAQNVLESLVEEFFRYI